MVDASDDHLLYEVLQAVERAISRHRTQVSTVAATGGDAADGRSVFSSNKTGYARVLENIQLTGRQAMIYRSQHGGLLPGEGGGK